MPNRIPTLAQCCNTPQLVSTDDYTQLVIYNGSYHTVYEIREIGMDNWSYHILNYDQDGQFTESIKINRKSMNTIARAQKGIYHANEHVLSVIDDFIQAL